MMFNLSGAGLSVELQDRVMRERMPLLEEDLPTFHDRVQSTVNARSHSAAAVPHNRQHFHLPEQENQKQQQHPRAAAKPQSLKDLAMLRLFCGCQTAKSVTHLPLGRQQAGSTRTRHLSLQTTLIRHTRIPKAQQQDKEPAARDPEPAPRSSSSDNTGSSNGSSASSGAITLSRAQQQAKEPEPMPSSSDDGSSSSSSRIALGVGLLVAAAVILTATGGFGGLKDRVDELEQIIAASGPLGPLIFAAAYVTATILLFPASLLTLGAGYLFGPVKGTALVSVSATLGACGAFLVSRFIARPAVEAKLSEYPKFQAVYDGISRDGAKLVLLLRLSPLLPFNLLNYGLGVTKVGFAEYAAASWLGMLPGTFAYVYLGSVGKVAADAAEGAGSGGVDPVRVALYVVGGVATIWATKLISNAAATAIDSDSSSSK